MAIGTGLNRVRYVARLLRIPVLCLIVTIFAFRQADKADRVVQVGREPGAREAVTPVLSARRIPVALATPGRSARLSAPMKAALAEVPTASSCLVVTNDALRVLFAHNPSTPLTPASNQKLLTAYAALTQFGTEKRFGTLIATDSAVSNGNVQGDVWLIGGGDPLLATADYVASFKNPDQLRTPFEDLVTNLKNQGISRIRGSIIADATRFDAETTVRSWPSRFTTTNDNPVGPLSALLVNDGFTSFPRSGQEYGGSGPHTPARVPGEAAATQLLELLRAAGIAVDGPVKSGRSPNQPRILARVDSAPLHQVVGQMLRESDNTTAELLLKELGLAVKNQGTTAAGAAAVTSLLTEKGLIDPGVVVIDGSGLDSGNRVTCSVLARVLSYASFDGPIGQNLPTAARTGTLLDRFRGGIAEGRVHAKTGSLANATSLSGFADANGERVVFAMMVNAAGAEDYKPIEEQMATALLYYPEGPALAALGPKPPVAASGEPAGQGGSGG